MEWRRRRIERSRVSRVEWRRHLAQLGTRELSEEDRDRVPRGRQQAEFVGDEPLPEKVAKQGIGGAQERDDARLHLQENKTHPQSKTKPAGDIRGTDGVVSIC